MNNDEIKKALMQRTGDQPLSASQVISQQAKAETGITLKALSNSIGNSLRDVTLSGGMSNVYDVDSKGNYQLKYKNYLGSEGNENRLAEEQSWSTQLGNAAARFGLKTLNYAGENIATWTYGIGSAISQGSLKALWDNDVSNFFDDQTAKIDRNFGIYYTDEEKSRSALGKMGTWSYVVDGVSNGMAFIGGALLPEIALAVVTGGLSVPASLARMSLKIGLKSIDNIATSAAKKSTEGVVKTLAKNVNRAESLKELRKLNRTTAWGSAIGETAKSTAFLARSSAFEAGMEARHNFHDNVDQYINKYKTKNGIEPSFEELQNFISEADKQANGVFMGNLAVLSISNAAMFGKIVGLPSLTPKSVSKAWQKAIGLGVTTLEDGTKVLGKANKFQKVLGATVPIAGSILTEGVWEEGTQGIIGKAMTNYLDGKYINKDASMTYLDAFKEGVAEQYGTSDGLHEILMGGLIGLIGGNVSAAITMPATKLGVQGFEGASFGIPGLFNDSVTKRRERLVPEIDAYNKELETFRNANRANSINSFKNENIKTDGVFEDTVVNYNFIKSSNRFKDISDVEADFNTTVDLMQFNSDDVKNANMSEDDILNYKEQLKTNFKQDLEAFKMAESIVNRLDITNDRLKEGNLTELKDSLIFTLMSSDKAKENSKKIAQNISDLTGVGNIYDVANFFYGVNNENLETAQEINQTIQERDSLVRQVAELGAKISTQPTETDSQRNKMKELSIKREQASQRLLDLQQKESQLRDILSNNVSTNTHNAFSKIAETSPTVDSLLQGLNSLESYVKTLQKQGKEQDSKDLNNLLTQFKNLNAVSLAGQDAVSRMIATDFFKSDKNLSALLGNKYEASPEFIKTIEDNSEIIEPFLTALGVTEGNVSDRVVKMMNENELLSDREKFLIESMARVIVAGENINNIVETANKELNGTQEQETVRTGDRLRNINIPNELNSIEQLNNLIKQIINQIDLISNKPTKEALDKIKSLEKQLADARQRLLDLQNGKIVTENAVQEQEQETSNESEEEIIINHVNQILIDFPEIIEESTEEEIEEAFNEAIQDNFLEKAVETLRNDLEDLRNSELPDQTLIEQIEQQIEQYEREINGENIGVNDGETSDTLQEGVSRTPEAGTIEDSTQNDNSIRQQETEEEIKRLEEEINELQTPFKFMNSETYIEYVSLLDQQIENPDNVDQARLAELETDVNQWITIMGTQVGENDDVNLSDLVRQLVALNNAEIVEGSGTSEVTEEEIDNDERKIQSSTKNNFNIGVNPSLVVSREKKKDGVVYTLVSNISLDGLRELSGAEILDNEVEITPDTKTIWLNPDVVRRINEKGSIKILTSDVQVTGTYSSPIVKLVTNMDGTTSYEMFEGDFDNEVNEEKASNVKKGDSLRVMVSRNNEWNNALFDKLEEEQDEYENPSNLEELAEEQFNKDVVKDRATNDIQVEIRMLEAKNTTDSKARLINVRKKLQTRLNELREKAKDKVLKKLMSQEVKMSPELRQEFIDTLKIYVIDKDGNIVQVLKGTRSNESSKTENGRGEIEALRTEIIKNNEDKLFSLLSIEGGSFIAEGITVKVDKVYPGLPNYRLTQAEDNKVGRQYKPISEKDISNISDIGYVQNGKVFTRNGTEDFEKGFVKSSIENNSNTKQPIIIVNRGAMKIAVPVRVTQDEAPINSSQLYEIYNNENFSEADKAIKMNNLLAQAGLDVTQTGNSVIALGDKISQEKLNKIVAKFENITYLRNVDSWTNKNVSIQDSILNAGASTALNLSEPFKSIKIRFDLNEYKPQSPNKIGDESDSKQKEVKNTHINPSNNVGLFKNHLNRCR